MGDSMRLNDLKIGEEAIVTIVEANNNIKKRLLDIGLVKGSQVKPVLKASNNMVAYDIKGAIIAIRKDDTKEIKVEVI